MIRSILALIAPLLFCACATTTPFGYTPTMEADPTEIGVEGLVLINELGRAYEPSPRPPAPAAAPAPAPARLCDKMLPSFQEAGKYAYARYGDGKQLPEFMRCLYFKKATPGEVKHHLLAGLALSDLYCDTFFRRIAARRAKRGYARDVANDVGAAVTAVLGLAKAGSGVTGGVGAGFGLADGLIRDYDERFVVGADLYLVRNRVLDAQKTKRATLSAEEFKTYPEANSAIIEYANLCSYLGMQQLVNDSLRKDINRDELYQQFVDSVARGQVFLPQVDQAKERILKESQEGAPKPVGPEIKPGETGKQ